MGGEPSSLTLAIGGTVGRTGAATVEHPWITVFVLSCNWRHAPKTVLGMIHLQLPQEYIPQQREHVEAHRQLERFFELNSIRATGVIVHNSTYL